MPSLLLNSKNGGIRIVQWVLCPLFFRQVVIQISAANSLTSYRSLLGPLAWSVLERVPESVPENGGVRRTPNTLGDTPRETSGPKGLRDSCSWTGSSQDWRFWIDDCVLGWHVCRIKFPPPPPETKWTRYEKWFEKCETWWTFWIFFFSAWGRGRGSARRWQGVGRFFLENPKERGGSLGWVRAGGRGAGRLFVGNLGGGG